MQESVVLSENDLRLINALQIRPRAEWSLVGQALNLNPITASRRWQRLTSSGLAWITAQFGRISPPGCFAYVALNCESGFKEIVADTISQDPQTTSVEITTGHADLLVSVAVVDLASFTAYLLDRVERLPGVVATRTSLITRFYSEGSRWRLRALSDSQVATLSQGRGGTASRSSEATQLSELDRKLFLALGDDGRRSHAELARQLDTSVATVRRRLERLFARGAVGMRCEVAHFLTPWPLQATVNVQVAPGDLATAGRILSSFPETRLCVAVTGEQNLIVAAQLHDLSDLHRIEIEWASKLPASAAVEWSVTLRTVKRMGRILDDQGRSVSAVPMDLWAKVPDGLTARNTQE